MEAIGESGFILIGPQFYTSLMPILLVKELAQALPHPAPDGLHGKPGRELSPGGGEPVAGR